MHAICADNPFSPLNSIPTQNALYASPLGNNPTKREKKKKSTMSNKGGLYKKLQIPTLPPKWPRSGVTFHYNSAE